MVIYRVDYKQKSINEQITVAKHIWKVKGNAHSSYILESVYRNNWLELLTNGNQQFQKTVNRLIKAIMT